MAVPADPVVEPERRVLVAQPLANQGPVPANRLGRVKLGIAAVNGPHLDVPVQNGMFEEERRHVAEWIDFRESEIPLLEPVACHDDHGRQEIVEAETEDDKVSLDPNVFLKIVRLLERVVARNSRAPNPDLTALRQMVKGLLLDQVAACQPFGDK